MKPDLNADDHRIEIISLPFNAGHSTKHVGKWSGWMRSVLLGLQYAQVADVEYFVYVEQDVLLRGEGIIEHCIKEMRTPYMFGSGIGTPQIIQQSFFIMHRAGINDFVSRLAAIPFRDSELCAEDKFVIATSWTLTHLSGVLARLNRPARQLILRRFANYDLLPVGFGRTRPVDFNNKYFYFQHGTDKELEMYSEALTGFRT